MCDNYSHVIDMKFIVVTVLSIVLTSFNKQTEAVIDNKKAARIAKEGDAPFVALIKVLHPHNGRKYNTYP